MVVFLGLSSGGQSKGTVEIDHLEWPGGEVSDNWEWMGGPDGYDGGTWEWGSLYGKPCMDLTSNLSGGLVARVFSSKWDNGPVPPNTPWFSPKGDEKDKLYKHYQSQGLTEYYFWELK